MLFVLGTRSQPRRAAEEGQRDTARGYGLRARPVPVCDTGIGPAYHTGTDAGFDAAAGTDALTSVVILILIQMQTLIDDCGCDADNGADSDADTVLV